MQISRGLEAQSDSHWFICDSHPGRKGVSLFPWALVAFMAVVLRFSCRLSGVQGRGGGSGLMWNSLYVPLDRSAYWH